MLTLACVATGVRRSAVTSARLCKELGPTPAIESPNICLSAVRKDVCSLAMLPVWNKETFINVLGAQGPNLNPWSSNSTSIVHNFVLLIEMHHFSAERRSTYSFSRGLNLQH